MRARWLGWAGVEIEAEGETVVIDPLAQPEATFAALGDRASEVGLPPVVAPRAQGAAAAGLLTHLHRDHADATALAAALAPGAPVFEPPRAGGSDLENLALAQATAELDRAGLRRVSVEPWERSEAGPFSVTALPAVDGLGDPQVSWLVEHQGSRMLHLGDTLFHGFWWRIAHLGPFDVVFAPINGAAVSFPHLRPPSPLQATLDPVQAAHVGELLGAAVLVPMHFGGYGIEPWYRPVEDAAERFARAAAGKPYEVRALAPGDTVEAGTAAAPG